jgi:hypothetical protein
MNNKDNKLIFEAFTKSKPLNEDMQEAAAERRAQQEEMQNEIEAETSSSRGEEDESVGDSSNFEDKAEKFAGVIGDIELEYLVNLSGGQFEILKGFLQDEMGYRDLGQYKRN